MVYSDIAELTKKMQELFRNDKLVESFGKNAKEFAKKEFSKEKYYNEIYSIYKELAKGEN